LGITPYYCRMNTQQRLTELDREQIFLGLQRGERASQIARSIGRHRSVVTREIARNRIQGIGYSAIVAHAKSIKRTTKRRKRKLDQSPELWCLVRKKLKLYWSPQQISGYLRRTYPGQSDMQISHEAIYSYIYILPRGGLKKSLIACLRRGKTKRGIKPHQAAKRSQIPDLVSVDDRPNEVDGRQIPGHWEGDLIMGAGNRSAMGTLVERTTRFTMLVKLDYKDSDYTCLSYANKLGELPEMLRRSLTYDRGKELTYHSIISNLAGVKVYFCDPHSPWQRGTNENTNGLLRQYFPKGTDFNTVPEWVMQEVQDQLNERPRAVLDFDNPKQKFSKLVALQT
jgi:transposase, IS30 family